MTHVLKRKSMTFLKLGLNTRKTLKNLNLSSYYLHKDDAKPESYLNDRDCRRFPPNISRTALFPLYFAFIGSEFSTFHWLELSKN